MRLAATRRLEPLIVGGMDAVLTARECDGAEKPALYPADDRRRSDVGAVGHVLHFKHLLGSCAFVFNHLDLRINLSVPFVKHFVYRTALCSVYNALDLRIKH